MATAPTHPAQVTVSVTKPASPPASPSSSPSLPGDAIGAPPVDVTGELATLDGNLRSLTGFGLAHWLAQLLSERYGAPAVELLPPIPPAA